MSCSFVDLGSSHYPFAGGNHVKDSELLEAVSDGAAEASKAGWVAIVRRLQQ